MPRKAEAQGSTREQMPRKAEALPAIRCFYV
jgi:hypothetical protein